MAFSEAERTDIRRFCGYPAQGTEPGLHDWRFHQACGPLEYRMQRLSAAEERVVRHYLATLTGLERAVTDAGANLDTERAAVWTHNPHEVRDRMRLFDAWRRRLCGFVGVAPGPALGASGVAMVV
jgi:hypothetical protein